MALHRYTAETKLFDAFSCASLATADAVLSSAYDNSGGANTSFMYARFSIDLDWDTTPPNDNSLMRIFLLYADDADSYSDGDATPVEPHTPVAWSFSVQNVLTQQYQRSTTPIPLLPYKFKVLIWNGTGQTTNTGVFDMYGFNLESV